MAWGTKSPSNVPREGSIDVLGNKIGLKRSPESFRFCCRPDGGPVPIVDLLYNGTHSGKNGLIRQNLPAGIYEQNIHPSDKLRLLPSVSLPDPALEKVPLHRPLEQLLRNGYHNPALPLRIILQEKIAHILYGPVPPFGKKQRNVRLAAQSFPLGKSIADESVHFYFER